MPSYGRDPWRWLDAALAVARGYGYEVLFPTQEQVAVLARAADRVAQAWVATAVPSFEALVRVQDKVSAAATLAEAGCQRRLRPWPGIWTACEPSRSSRSF